MKTLEETKKILRTQLDRQKGEVVEIAKKLKNYVEYEKHLDKAVYVLAQMIKELKAADEAAERTWGQLLIVNNIIVEETEGGTL